MTVAKVAVIMPVYNQAWVAHRAVESIAAQTFRDFEFVIIDDGSTDGLDGEALAKTVGVPNFAWGRRPEPGGSAAKAVNVGVRMTSAPYVTWVSGDNLMTSDWLEKLVAELDAGAGAAYGGFTFIPAFRADVEPIVADKRLSLAAVASYWAQRFQTKYLFERHEPTKQITREDCYYGPAHLAHRDVWTAHEGGASHDLGWWLRCEEECEKRGWPIVGVDRNMCLYLAHDERCVKVDPSKYDSRDHLEAAKIRRQGSAGTPTSG